MKQRIFERARAGYGLGLGVLLLFAAAAAFSGSDKSNRDRAGSADGLGPLAIKLEKRNPWTEGRLNNDPEEFQFAIIADRTGGHRAKVFEQAVARLNLLQPEFVLSVGDFIEGGKQPEKKLEAEWREFDRYVQRLQMPFFYVAGNHDNGNAQTDELWQKRYGRRHYHFVYRNVLFLCLNTEDPPPGGPKGRIGKDQINYVKKVLSDNKSVRWTIVCLHRPIWQSPAAEMSGWGPIEKALADRAYTVFCGHIHAYRKFVRQGRNYYQVATTGGESRMRGIAYGEFDHVVWVTMKKEGPLLANILLDSVLPDDLKVPAANEEAMPIEKKKTQPVRGTVYLDGTPVAWAQVVLTPVEEKLKRRFRADATTEGDGSFVPSTWTANDGLVAGKYIVTVEKRRPRLTAEGKPGPNLLPSKYANAETSGLTVEIGEGGGEVKLDLSSRK